jgi:hypothetical protein
MLREIMLALIHESFTCNAYSGVTCQLPWHSSNARDLYSGDAGFESLGCYWLSAVRIFMDLLSLFIL